MLEKDGRVSSIAGGDCNADTRRSGRALPVDGHVLVEAVFQQPGRVHEVGRRVALVNDYRKFIAA